MKLSKETINILKNFSTINQNLILLPGKIISTISNEDNFIGYANITEEIPQKFGIYDLTEFLGIISIFEDSELEFNEKYVKINQGNNSIKYFSAEESLLKTPKFDGKNYPTTVDKFPEAEIKLELTEEQLSLIFKTSSVLKSSDFSIIGDGTNIKVVVGDKKNSTSNKYQFNVLESDLEFTANFKINNIKIIPGKYNIEISMKKISKWTTGEVGYFVGLESDSEF